jgi:hypothetical protein
MVGSSLTLQAQSKHGSFLRTINVGCNVRRPNDGGHNSQQCEGWLAKALAVASAPAPLLHPSLAEVYSQKVAAPHEALRDPGTRDEAFARGRARDCGQASDLSAD